MGVVMVPEAILEKLEPMSIHARYVVAKAGAMARHLGGGRQSRGGSLAGPALRNYVAPARARCSNCNR